MPATTVTTAGVIPPLCPAWKPRSRTGDKLFEWTENIWIAVRCGAQLRDYGVLHHCTARVMAAREPKLNALPGPGTGATIFHGIFTQHTICTLWPATVLVIVIRHILTIYIITYGLTCYHSCTGGSFTLCICNEVKILEIKSHLKWSSSRGLVEPGWSGLSPPRRHFNVQYSNNIEYSFTLQHSTPARCRAALE